MNISVLGAGAWGTALAVQAAARHEVLLWARDRPWLQSVQAAQCNARYLPGVALPQSLQFEADWDVATRHAGQPDGLIVVATPMAALREMLSLLPTRANVLWLCKGFEAGTGLLGHEVAQLVRPGAPSGVLSGPSFAQEVAAGQPTALVMASSDAALVQQAVDAFHTDRLRVYASADPIGVEVGGAVKNVLAIAVGIADGLCNVPGAISGLNARAALITRGLAEMTRMGAALGARTETFMGLSGLGDLVLTATGDLSRNRRVGLELARGKTLTTILSELGHVSEGVYSAATVMARAQKLGVQMPITQAVVAVLQGQLGAIDAVNLLMGREARSEH